MEGKLSARHNMTVNFRQNESLPGEERKAISRCSKDATVKEATVSCDTWKRTRTVNKWPRRTVFLQGTQACSSFCLLSCCSDKHHDQEKLWGLKGFSLQVLVHRWGNGKHGRGGRNRQRPWRTTGAGVSPPTVVWILPHWLLTKKMLHRLAYTSIWCRQFFNWCFFFLFLARWL